MATPIENPVRIRAHHLLCLQGFQGYGYNEEFVSNMDRIAERIRRYPEFGLKVIVGTDVVCSPCRHNSDSQCRKNPDSNQKVMIMDEKILRKLNLRKNTVIQAGAVLSLIGQRLQKKSDLAGICDECGWRSQCLWYMSRGD